MEVTKKGGCILIDKDKKQVILVYRAYANDYTFPKGHIEGNESLIECAIRETEEETKRKPLILSKEPVYIEKYTTPKGEHVENYYYLAIDNGKSDNTSTDTHPIIYVDYDKVYEKLTYTSAKQMWNTIKDIIENMQEIYYE